MVGPETWRYRTVATLGGMDRSERLDAAARRYRLAGVALVVLGAAAGTPLLPALAGALHRHLQELPSVENGLGLTHHLLLQALAEGEAQRAGRVVGLVMHDRDPLPGLGDFGYDQALRDLAALPDPLVQRSGGHAYEAWHLDEVAITDSGRAVLEGRRDGLALPFPERWVGGVRIAPGQRNWRWDERARSVASQ